MSGAIEAVKKVAQMGYDTGVGGLRSAQSLAQGNSVSDAFNAGAGRGIKGDVAGIKSIAGPIVGGVVQDFKGDPDNVPNVAAADPAAQSAEAARQRAVAQRQEQINAQNNKPGRGGTILTDNFQYKV